MNDISNGSNTPQIEPETDAVLTPDADGGSDSSSVISSLNDAFRQGMGQGMGQGAGQGEGGDEEDHRHARGARQEAQGR